MRRSRPEAVVQSGVYTYTAVHCGLSIYLGGVPMVRADKQGPHRVAFERNKKRILKTKHTCGICGQDVDKTLAYPHPLSPAIDHIIPVSKGGHPSNMDNLQLTHWKCNRDKSDKLYSGQTNTTETIGNRNLPKTIEWTSYEFKT